MCDEERKKNPEKCKLQPLFGIVMTVKDLYDMKGFITTFGCASKLMNPKI